MRLGRCPSLPGNILVFNGASVVPEILESDFHVTAIRLDSGDLAALAKESRRMLNEAGLTNVEIFASSGLDEYAIEELLRTGAPIDGFGVGTHMGSIGGLTVSRCRLQACRVRGLTAHEAFHR